MQRPAVAAELPVAGQLLVGDALDVLQPVVMPELLPRAVAQRRNIAQLGRSQQRELLFHRKIDKLALNVIVLPEAKTNGRHLRGRKNFPTFARAQLALSELGQLEPARNRLAKCSDAERLERQPNFERAKTSR